MAKPAKTHPEDLLMARDWNRAISFTAHLRNGREFAATVRDLPTYEAAQAAAADLEAQAATQGRRALIYAVCKGNYSILATPTVLALASSLRAQEQAA